MIAKQPYMDKSATHSATYRTEEIMEKPINVGLLTISSNTKSIISKIKTDKMDKELIERGKVKQEKRMEKLTPNIDSRQDTTFMQEPHQTPAPARSPMGQNCKTVYYNRGKFDTSPGR